MNAADLAGAPGDPTDPYVRFGPGVPAGDAPANDRASAVWTGALEPGGATEIEHEDEALAARRRNQRWILPLTVLILVLAILAYYLWNRSGPGLSVHGASVHAGSTTSVGCGGTERLSGIVLTDGGEGAITYEWLRSDGTTSGPLTQSASRGTQQVAVALEWNFEGYGTFKATATLRVLSPDTASAAASFTYRCVRP